MTSTDLLAAVKSAPNINIRGKKLKAEAFLKVEDNNFRTYETFPLTLNGLHKAIEWKTQTIQAWKDGKTAPKNFGSCTLQEALDLTDTDAKGWSHLKTNHRTTAPARAQVGVDFIGRSKSIDRVTAMDLENFRKHLATLTRGKKNKKLASSTINQYLMMLHKCFETARKRGRYSLDGTKVIPDFPYMDSDGEENRRCFEYDIDDDGTVLINEEADFYKVCDSWGAKFTELKYLVQIGIHTGMRKGEILKLKCSDFNFRRSEITLPKGITKAKKKRVVRMNDIIRPIIKYFNKVRKAMGLDKDPNFTFHSSRYTNITRLLEAGEYPTTVKEWVGHKSIETTMGYVTTNMNFVGKCAEAITKHPATIAAGQVSLRVAQ
jgi:integrase